MDGQYANGCSRRVLFKLTKSADGCAMGVRVSKAHDQHDSISQQRGLCRDDGQVALPPLSKLAEDTGFVCPVFHRHSITCLECCGPNLEIVITGSEDRTFKIWDFSEDCWFSDIWKVQGLSSHNFQIVSGSPNGLWSSFAVLSCPLVGRQEDCRQCWIVCIAMALVT